MSAPVSDAAEPEVRYLDSVECPTATSCFAVGAANGRTLLQHWNGSAWSVVPGAAGAGASPLGDVSCATANRCVAVGYSKNQTLLVEHWNGRAWTIRPTPLGRHQTTVGAVSCATPSACVAVGVASIEGNSGLFGLRWNGTKWTTMKVPPTTDPVTPLDVSCPDANTCVAVGWRQAPIPVGQVRPHKAVRYSSALLWKRGSGWSVMATPKPQGVAFDGLRGVSCPSATRCYAAGSSRAQHQVLSWNGTKWTVAQLPRRAQSGLMDISCATETSCVAVGETGEDTKKTLTERWDGTAWSITPSPNAPGNYSTLNGVSCASVTSCHAVGAAWNDGGISAKPLRLRSDGTRWTRS